MFDDIPFLRISQITLTDMIDIAVIAYFVFRILIWIKETRAWSLFKGIVIIVAASVLSNVLGLNTVFWIITNAFNMGMIAILVLFQPELRKALEQIGRGRLVSFFGLKAFGNDEEKSMKLSHSTANAIIKAAKTMADARTGAIIVIEQDVALGDHEQTGIPIDAVVTSQLLINIFEDKTPLHDGAVIIRSNRIAAATCILPLTQKNVSHELGTRHRASIGASEVSDAYVIVVSEESGGISLAQGGSLKRNLTEKQIKDILTERNFNARKRNNKVLWKKGRDVNEKNT